jgi:multimeric flavodoxin WrbA
MEKGPMTTGAAAPTERRFLFVVGSGRSGGNTEALARLAARQLAPQVVQCWLCLRDLELPPFRDASGRDDPVSAPAGVERMLLEETLAATDLVIVTPLYWYSVSWSVKLYLDYWANWERLPEVDFKTRMRAKTLWAVTVMADEDQQVAAPLLDILALCARYLKANFAGALLGSGSWPGDILRDTDAVERARNYFDYSASRVLARESGGS